MAKKSSSDSASALLAAGKKAYFKRDFKAAFPLFEKAAELGDAEAQCRLGEFYDDFGHGFPVDFKKARELYEKSYAQGFFRAGAQLSTLFEDNQAGMRDKKKAAELLDEACSHDNPLAKFFKAIKTIAEENHATSRKLFLEAEEDEEFVREFGKLSPLTEFAKKTEEAPEEHEKELEKLVKNFREQAKRVVNDSGFNLLCALILSGEDDDAAETFFRKAAENGPSSTKAECAYFLWLRGKKGAGPLALEAVENLQSVKGMLTLGVCYLDGTDMPKKTDEAEFWLKKAIKTADKEDDIEEIALAEYWLGRLELEFRDEIEAAQKYFRMAAEKGCEQAMIFLCKILFSREDPETFEWAQKLAAGKYWEGDSYLASCYRDGIGVKKDHEKFVELARKLNENDIPDGTYMLATAYRNGLGVPADTEKAIEIFKRAEKLGDTDAAGQIAEIYFHREPADPRAFKWAKKGAEKENDLAMIILACCYRDGIGVEHDEDSELEWNLHAAEHGNPVGAFNAGLIHYGRDEYAQARELLSSAYEIGIKDAASVLARCEFEDSDGDDEAALRWAKIAVKNNNSDGYPVLGACYYNGRGGVKRNRARAVELWRKGGELGNKQCIQLLKDEDIPLTPANPVETTQKNELSQTTAASPELPAAGTHVFCVHCGTQNPGFANFCHACGKKLERP